MKYDTAPLSTVSSVARFASALNVLPMKVRAQVLHMLHPELSSDATQTLFECLQKMDLSNSRYNLIGASNSGQVHVFSPPCSHCLECNVSLVSYNSSNIGTDRAFFLRLREVA